MEPETAITRFAMAELTAAGWRMAHRLRRIPASGIYGDAYEHRTLWAELRFEASNGPTDLLETAWDQTLHPFAKDVSSKLTQHTKVLLSYYLDEFPDNGRCGAVDENAICLAICNVTRELAAMDRS